MRPRRCHVQPWADFQTTCRSTLRTVLNLRRQYVRTCICTRQKSTTSYKCSTCPVLYTCKWFIFETAMADKGAKDKKHKRLTPQDSDPTKSEHTLCAWDNPEIAVSAVPAHSESSKGKTNPAGTSKGDETAKKLAADQKLKDALEAASSGKVQVTDSNLHRVPAQSQGLPTEQDHQLSLEKSDTSLA